MPLKDRQRRFVQRFLPGTIEQIEAMGPGEFEGSDPELDCVGTDEVIGVAVRFKYTFADGMVIELRSRWRLRDGRSPYVPGVTPVDVNDWERYSYALHYGRSFADVKFRVDLDDNFGHHVHMPPDTGPDRHIPHEEITPDTRNMSATRFLEIVAKYRSDKKYPFKRKKR